MSNELSQLLDWDQLVWNVLGSLTQPLFQGGRLSAERALAEADDREAVANYAQIVLTALREVEGALAGEIFLTAQHEALSVATLEAREAARLAGERYLEGLGNIVTLLESQRRAFNAESSLLVTANQRLQNRIDLYLALGGDYRAPVDQTTENQWDRSRL